MNTKMYCENQKAFRKPISVTILGAIMLPSYSWALFCFWWKIMRWFKHFSDSLDDPFIVELMDKFSHQGYVAYFGLIEIISKENGNKLSGKLEISPTYLRRKLRISSTKLQQVFNYCSTKGKLSFNFSKETWKFDCPKLLDLKDNYQKDLQVAGKKPSNHKEVEEEEEKNKPFLPDSVECRLADYLLQYILKRNPEHKKPDMQTWAKNIDKMIRLDKRTPEKIKEIISWSQEDSFWQNNILSTGKLREQFDQLNMKMEKTKPLRPTEVVI